MPAPLSFQGNDRMLWAQVYKELSLVNPFAVADGGGLPSCPPPAAAAEPAAPEGPRQRGGGRVPRRGSSGSQPQPDAALGLVDTKNPTKEPLGDPLDRAAVTQALWTRQEAILAAKKAYLVITWQRPTEERPANPATAITADLKPLDRKTRRAAQKRLAKRGAPEEDEDMLNVACFVHQEPPREEHSAFHKDLKVAFDSVDHDQYIPVVIVDPCVRRKHAYTYLVVVAYPWGPKPLQLP
eukprot:TRINITY_DN18209_c0_g1_i2.p1 TRINITY_DN18209_c0_g1~~TRINITY_DN18209_c0_g1_i2.p1  ORF type:complete len:271 (+),score=50.78 TRINITY_DN18209_c0_g1_i2:99-815(+)